MNEEKKRRVVSAVVSGGILLLVILLVILVYQIVGIYTRNNRINALDGEIQSLKTQIEQTDDSIKEWSERWKIEQRARELGMIYEDDDE